MSRVDFGGVLLFVLFGALLTAGLVTGEMPINYAKTLNTRRASNPAMFWAIATSFALIALLGLAIATMDLF
jgi:hypothetical protein